MHSSRRFVRCSAAAVLFASLVMPIQAKGRPAAAVVQPASSSAAPLPKIRIENFGKVTADYYRGAQPKATDYKDLAALGIKTVIDLTRDGRDDEPGLVKKAGMAFYRIPLITTEKPSAAAVAEFLQLVSDPANLPVFVHCQGGRHRTGAMTAVYQMTHDGLTADKAYQQMKHFKFEGFPGHPELKSFVYDFYTQLTQALAPATR